jgi:hypothetical protein
MARAIQVIMKKLILTALVANFLIIGSSMAKAEGIIATAKALRPISERAFRLQGGIRLCQSGYLHLELSRNPELVKMCFVPHGVSTDWCDANESGRRVFTGKGHFSKASDGTSTYTVAARPGWKLLDQEGDPSIRTTSNAIFKFNSKNRLIGIHYDTTEGTSGQVSSDGFNCGTFAR